MILFLVAKKICLRVCNIKIWAIDIYQKKPEISSKSLGDIGITIDQNENS